MPFLVLCQRKGCEGWTEVADRYRQQQQKYCSRRCRNLALDPTVATTKGRLGGLTSGSNRRRRILARVQGLTPLEAFRLGYQCGLSARRRQTTRRAGGQDRPRWT